MLRDVWHWYRQFPAWWLYRTMRALRLPFKVCCWALPWCGVGYVANDFRTYRKEVARFEELGDTSQNDDQS